MLNYVLKRLLGLIPTLLIVAVLVFLFVHLLPGDPARLAAGPEADEATVELVRQDLGLDKPIHIQFVTFFGNALRGEFGRSMSSKRPVSREIAERFMPTFWLTLASMGWSVLFGMGIGIVSAVWRNRWPDRLGMTLAVSGISFPAFALGMLFTSIQAYEYAHAPFGFVGNTYSSAFYMATGFHGFHVIIGTIFLIVCLKRAYNGDFTPKQHFGFEAAAWYWHFVDVVWLFLFIAVYIWGGWGYAVH